MGKELHKFQTLLRELFQFDCADLDFGLYRILNARRALFEDWIDQRLPAKVAAALATGAVREDAKHDARLQSLADILREEFGRQAIDGDGRLREGIPGRSASEYSTLWQARHDRSAHVAGAGLEAEIYNRLYDFFRRYYEDGDFLSLRRYGSADTYAVPYNGQEVMLHWANKDQYYIKTGEHFTDYRFRAGDKADAWHVDFKLRQAEGDRDNTKSGDRRLFFFDAAAAGVDADARTLTVPVEYRAATAAELDVLGRDPQTALNDEAEKKLLARQKLKAQPVLAGALRHDVAADDKKPQTLLVRHLRRYTRRNTSDFFIHKDLAGFLTRELDYWLKAEVLGLDALLSGGEQPARAWLQTLACLRAVGGEIIGFLGQLEDFQKRLFEKRKFVTRCDWCLTLDHVEHAGLTDELVRVLNGTDGGRAQKAEWIKLFAIDEVKAETGKPGWKDRVTAEFLRSQPFLVLDTVYMPQGFVDALLGLIKDLDGAVANVLLKGDNWQGARLLLERYLQSIDVLITDPPYNTGSDGFPYKDAYAHASWITMISDRVQINSELVSQSGFLFFHIGDKNHEFRESQNLLQVLDAEIGRDNYISQLVWKNKSGGGNDSEFFAQDHEYIFCYSANRSSAILREDPDAEVTTSYNRSDKKGQYALERLDKQSIRYSKSGDFEIVGPDGKKYWPKHKDQKRPNATWRWSKEKVKKDYKQLVFEAGNVYTKNYKKEGAVPRSLLADERFGRTRTGKTELFSLFASEVFKNPKPTKIERFLLNVAAGNTAVVLDPFAGSGTVAQAVINQNRADHAWSQESSATRF